MKAVRLVRPLESSAGETGDRVEAMVLAFGVLPYHVPATHELPPRGGFSSGLNPTKCRSFDRTHVVQRAVSELVGASEETGGIFDPLGLATDEVR